VFYAEDGAVDTLNGGDGLDYAQDYDVWVDLLYEM
jgi:hypothetical protein